MQGRRWRHDLGLHIEWIHSYKLGTGPSEAIRRVPASDSVLMNAPTWQHSKPLPQPTRHRMRGRTDFEDSLLSARREEQAKEKRRFQAMTEALRSRNLPTDPDGSRFRAAREKAIAARRAENARLEAMFQASGRQGARIELKQIEEWDGETESTGHRESRPLLQWVGLAVVLGCVGLAAGLAYPDLLSHLTGH